jgi:hypothetical protein
MGSVQPNLDVILRQRQALGSLSLVISSTSRIIATVLYCSGRLWIGEIRHKRPSPVY